VDRDAEHASMPNLRTSTALRQLNDFGHQPNPTRWSWAIARVEPTGRLLLPVEARAVLGARAGRRTPLRGLCHRDALVLNVDEAGGAFVVDSRGRLLVPAWLRTGTAAPVVVGTRIDAALVLIAPTATLDPIGDLLSGTRR
jgi:hypothetical protein